MHGYFQKIYRILRFFFSDSKTSKDPWEPCVNHTLTHTLIGCSSLISPADSAQH